jgi:hypothetical protein
LGINASVHEIEESSSGAIIAIGILAFVIIALCILLGCLFWYKNRKPVAQKLKIH